jgi:hypothetical protein
MRIFIALIFSLLIFKCAYAESYLIVKSDTNEVVSYSPQDDAVMQSGWKKIVLTMDYKDAPLDMPATYYKYIGNNFIKNTDKITAEYNQQQEAIKIANDELVIQGRINKIAIDSLNSDGVQLTAQKNIQLQTAEKAKVVQ